MSNSERLRRAYAAHREMALSVRRVSWWTRIKSPRGKRAGEVRPRPPRAVWTLQQPVDDASEPVGDGLDLVEHPVQVSEGVGRLGQVLQAVDQPRHLPARLARQVVHVFQVAQTVGQIR